MAAGLSTEQVLTAIQQAAALDKPEEDAAAERDANLNTWVEWTRDNFDEADFRAYWRYVCHTRGADPTKFGFGEPQPNDLDVFRRCDNELPAWLLTKLESATA